MVEGLVWLVGTAVYMYYRPQDIDGFILIMITYLCTLVSFIIGVKTATLSGKMIRVKDTPIICGHISNAIKLLTVLIALCFIVYFVLYTISSFDIRKRTSLIYYLLLFTGFIWALSSVFSFIVFIIIANRNRKSRFAAIDDLGFTTTPDKNQDNPRLSS